MPESMGARLEAERPLGGQLPRFRGGDRTLNLEHGIRIDHLCHDYTGNLSSQKEILCFCHLFYDYIIF